MIEAKAFRMSVANLTIAWII